MRRLEVCLVHGMEEARSSILLSSTHNDVVLAWAGTAFCDFGGLAGSFLLRQGPLFFVSLAKLALTSALVLATGPIIDGYGVYALVPHEIHQTTAERAQLTMRRTESSTNED